MDRLELAWAAGFWDGEGSAWLTRAEGRVNWQPQARINQSSTTGVPEVLIRFQRAVGSGSVKGPELEEGKEPLYRWVVSSRSDILATFEALRPWIGPVKRSQFCDVLGMKDRSSRPSDMSRSDEWSAWAAGLFDGEGSTYDPKHQSHAGYFTLEASITQSSSTGEPEVLRRFLAIVRAGKIYGPYPAGDGHAPVYRWKAHRATQIMELVKMLWPWLGDVKREQAERAIAVVNEQPALARGNPAWGNRKTHCVKGHEYETARVRPFRSRGKNMEPLRASKQCLACVRDHARRKRLDRKRRAAADQPPLT